MAIRSIARTGKAALLAAMLALTALPAAASAADETSAEGMRTVLITGANRGLGLEFARQYAADGSFLFLRVRGHAASEDNCGAAARINVYAVGGLAPLASICPDARLDYTHVFSSGWHGANATEGQKLSATDLWSSARVGSKEYFDGLVAKNKVVVFMKVSYRLTALLELFVWQDCVKYFLGFGDPSYPALGEI